MLNLSGNDYLGLASNETLLKQFFDQEGVQRGLRMSSSSSRLLTGNDPVYDALEADIANSYGKSALLLNSGYHANLGILPAISDSKTLVLADKLVHASMVDGIRLSNAQVHRFKHNDLKHLRTLLTNYASSFHRVVLMTESVFSMDGDLAPLMEYIQLKNEYPHLMLYVDEAHALGVRGPQGLGLCEELACIEQIDILVGTFGKALASMGAFVVCSETLKKLLVNRMRPLIFSTHQPPLQAKWTHLMWSKMKTMQQERDHLCLISNHLRAHLPKGVTLPEASQSHIVPCVIGDSVQTVLKAEWLQKHGFFAMPVRPPTVPQGSSRIRFSLSADMTMQEINQLTYLIQNKW
jgi:8-amino-7-oxononanoate synthase